MRTWADASVLIALEATGELRFLHETLGDVYVTEAVVAEILTDRTTSALREAVGSWIHVEKVRGDARRFRRLGLAKGEASLFLTPQGDALLLDDLAARRLAESEGRTYTGLLGLLRSSARTGAVSKSRALEILNGVARAGFRMRSDLYEEIRAELER